jgi:hypothetical protein
VRRRKITLIHIFHKSNKIACGNVLTLKNLDKPLILFRKPENTVGANSTRDSDICTQNEVLSFLFTKLSTGCVDIQKKRCVYRYLGIFLTFSDELCVALHDISQKKLTVMHRVAPAIRFLGASGK